MPTAFPDFSRLKPDGGKRSSKREKIVNVFLRQEGHLSADDLVDIIRREDQRISRATVYRTLQWMVDAGIARKVDFGEGRFRFEHSYRQPRHFHLICKTCHRSFEFLSSDIEALIEEVSSARAFTASQSVVQIYGTCESCRTGRPAAPTDVGHTDLVFARDALRIAIATERSGLEFYTRAARIAKDARGRKVFHDLALEEKEHLATLEERYRVLLERDPQLESRPTFLFFKGAANGLFAEGAERLLRGVNDQQALMIGIRCERGSHRFFKKYGERFEDSEGKQIFLEFADEERNHLDLLVREYRALAKGRGARRVGQGHPPRALRDNRVSSRALLIDLHLHTTASDGRLTPKALVAHATAAGVGILAVTDHDTTDGFDEAAAEAARLDVLAIPGIEITAVDRGRDVHMLAYFFDRHEPAFGQFLAAQRATRVTRIAEMAARLEALGMPVDVKPLVDEARRDTGKSIGRPTLARAMIDAGHVATTREAFDKWLAQGRPAYVERAGAPPEDVIGIVHGAGGIVSLAHPGRTRLDEQIPALRDAGLDAIEVYHSDHDAEMTASYLDMARRLDLLVTGGSDFHGEPAHGIEPGASALPEPEWRRLLDARGIHGGR